MSRLNNKYSEQDLKDLLKACRFHLVGFAGDPSSTKSKKEAIKYGLDLTHRELIRDIDKALGTW